MTDLIDTTEMYLRTIFELEEEGISPLRARIAERLGHSGPTVSQTVARMERDGLLRVAGDRQLELSETGRDLAIRVMRKHRLAERLLVDVIGLELEYVHDEACRWEHVISDRVERKLVALLGNLEQSPYGNPIPGLAALGAEGGDSPSGTVPLTELVGPGQREVTVRWIGEPLQADQGAREVLTRAGLSAGSLAVARLDGDEVLVRVGPDEVSVPWWVASHVFVTRA